MRETNLHVVLARYGCSVAVHFGWMRHFLQFFQRLMEPSQMSYSGPCLCLLACFPFQQLQFAYESKGGRRENEYFHLERC